MALPPLVEPAESLTPDEVRRYSRHLIIPEVGMVEVVSPTRARILMPLPMLESDLNILLLTR